MKKKSVLLGAILISFGILTFSVGSTYASYKSSFQSTSNTARVAKWDINMDQTIDLLGDSYQGDQPINDQRVIAPGSEGSYSFRVSGTAETSYRLRANVTGEDLTEGRIQYYIDDKGDPDEAMEFDEILYTLNAMLRNAKVTEHTIYWVWPADGETSEDTKIAQTVITDDNNQESAPYVSLHVVLTAEQTD